MLVVGGAVGVESAQLVSANDAPRSSMENVRRNGFMIFLTEVGVRGLLSQERDHVVS
jgi:hypothetical protein